MAMTVEGMVKKEEFLERFAAVYPELRRTALPKWDHTTNARRSSTDSIIGLPLYKNHITFCVFKRSGTSHCST